MQTIADKLQISVATVSRALRRVPGINAETRARVVATAAQLGYRIPKSYRSKDLENNTLQHIGVLIQVPQSHVSAPLYLVGMSEAAMSLNASLVFHYVTPDDCQKLLNSNFQPRAMQSGLLSGVIFIFHWPQNVVQAISQDIKAVSIMHTYPGVDMDMVGVDNHEGVELLLTRLSKLGHKKIGFIGHCPELHWSTQRFGGYVASLSRLGLVYDPNFVVDMSSDALTNQKCLNTDSMAQAEHLTRTQGVTAWICSTETLGQQLYAWMTSHGLRVPQDVSLTGFHRSDSPAPTDISLTSVTASYQAMGAAALKRVLYRIQNPAESTRRILFPFDLFNGETVGFPNPSPSPV